MEELSQEIARCAENTVALCEYLLGEPPDYSEASLVAVDEVLGRVSGLEDELTHEEIQNVVYSLGCYVLEVGRRQFGGRFCWFEQRNASVLVVGEPTFRVALLAQDHVEGRASGDAADNIPFFYTGFAEQVRRPRAGTDVLYV